jgi:hypothetical protein
MQSRITELDPPRKLAIARHGSGDVSFELTPKGNRVLLTVVASPTVQLCSGSDPAGTCRKRVCCPHERTTEKSGAIVDVNCGAVEPERLRHRLRLPDEPNLPHCRQ